MEEREEWRRKWQKRKEENLEKSECERERESGSSVGKGRREEGREEGRVEGGGLLRRCVTSAACWIEELCPAHFNPNSLREESERSNGALCRERK